MTLSAALASTGFAMTADLSWILHMVVSIGATIVVYHVVRGIYRHWRSVWCLPLLLTPLLLVVFLNVVKIPYQSYLTATWPLLWMIGPLMLAFAVPVYQHRDYIKQWWPALVVGTLAASIFTMSTAVLLAQWCGLSDPITYSMIGRSISLPFAFAVSNELGGVSSLADLFAVLSSISGIFIGEIILGVLRIKTDQARGAALGAISQVIGVARAHEHNVPCGVMASLTMIFSGALSVVLAPWVLVVFGR